MNRRRFLRTAFGAVVGVAALPYVAIKHVVSPAPKVMVASEMEQLVNATLRDLGKAKWTDITADLQKHVAIRNLLRADRIKLNP